MIISSSRFNRFLELSWWTVLEQEEKASRASSTLSYTHINSKVATWYVVIRIISTLETYFTPLPSKTFLLQYIGYYGSGKIDCFKSLLQNVAPHILL